MIDYGGAYMIYLVTSLTLLIADVQVDVGLHLLLLQLLLGLVQPLQRVCIPVQRRDAFTRWNPGNPQDVFLTLI